MARWERVIEIEAAPARVWELMSDVARWPEWTASIVSVQEASPSLGVGGSAVVDATGTPKSKWTVTRWEPVRGFDWRTSVRGAKTDGGHWIEPAGEGRSRVTLSIEVHGPFGWLFKPMISKVIVGNMEMEAEGLKKRSEG